jgi:hypothetical protein
MHTPSVEIRWDDLEEVGRHIPADTQLGAAYVADARIRVVGVREHLHEERRLTVEIKLGQLRPAAG